MAPKSPTASKRRATPEAPLAAVPVPVDPALAEVLDRVLRIGPNPKLPIIIPCVLTLPYGHFRGLLEPRTQPSPFARYKPDPLWLWARWRGTILQSTWRPTVYILVLGLSFITAVHADANTRWKFTAVRYRT